MAGRFANEMKSLVKMWPKLESVKHDSGLPSMCALSDVKNVFRFEARNLGRIPPANDLLQSETLLAYLAKMR